MKLLALFLAVALWFAVGGEERTETALNLPLEIVNLNPNLMVVSELPAGLQVRVTGPRSIIRALSQSRLVHPVDLAGVKPARHTIPLGPSAFPFPRGVTVTRVQPNPLTLTLTATEAISSNSIMSVSMFRNCSINIICCWLAIEKLVEWQSAGLNEQVMQPDPLKNSISHRSIHSLNNERRLDAGQRMPIISLLRLEKIGEQPPLQIVGDQYLP